jgi:hypothetical protein
MGAFTTQALKSLHCRVPLMFSSFRSSKVRGS